MPHTGTGSVEAGGRGGDPVPVVIADDARTVRAGEVARRGQAGVEVVEECADARALLHAVSVERPDVAVVDIRTPPTHTDEGLVAARQIRDGFPGAAVLLLSQYLDARYAQGCWPTSPRVSATCSRSEWRTSPCWWMPSAG